MEGSILRGACMRRIIQMTVVSLIVLIQSPVYSLTLDQAVQLGLKNSPDLQAAVWKTRAALDREKGADGGAPTMFKVGLVNIPTDSFSLNQDMMNQLVVGIKQTFSFPGKLSLKKDIAREFRKIREWDLVARKRRLTALIKEAYFRILYLDRVMRLTEKTSGLLHQFRSIARTRYAVGKGLLQDIAKADFEATRLKEKLILLANRRKRAAILFNRLLGRKPERKIAPLGPFTGQFRLLSLAAIHNRVLVQSTSLRKAEHRLRQVRWKRKLASRMLWPNFGIGTSYGMRTRSNTANLFSINIELSIPIFSKRGRQVTALKKKVAGERHSLEAVRQNVLKTSSAIFTDIRTRKKLLRLYADKLLPLAKLSVRSALSSYQVGKLEFISLVMAQLLQYRYQVANERNRKIYRTHFAHLEFLSGEKLIKEYRK